MPFDSPEDAIRIANDTPFGLSGAIHTRDPERGAELAKEIDSGMVHVNDRTIDDEPLVASGGEKASGYGRMNGPWALEEFTTLKWISVQHTPIRSIRQARSCICTSPSFTSTTLPTIMIALLNQLVSWT